jgi:hypothetical protein
VTPVTVGSQAALRDAAANRWRDNQRALELAKVAAGNPRILQCF